MKRLDILAELIMDSYNQELSKEGDFFKQEDFESFCAPFYYEVLQDDFDKTVEKMIKLGAILPSEEIVLNASWYTIKRFNVTKVNNKYKVTLPSVFSFNKDLYFTGVKAVYPTDNIGDCCGVFAKIKSDQCNTLKFLPASDKTIYWHPLGKDIIFERVTCGLKEVDIAHIPSLDDECDSSEVVVPEPYVSEIMRRTYNYMIQTKNGNVVDKTNNQNPNKVVQTEIAPK